MFIITGHLEKKAADTADFLLFFDRLFDSVNADTPRPPPGKKLKCAYSTLSGHQEFWAKSIDTLKTMKFYCPNKKVFVSVPTIKNFIFTLRNLLYICPKIIDTKKFQYVQLKTFNQDSLENLFGNIRSLGVRNVNPTCNQFVQNIKSLIINNFTSYHSLGANCEEDFSTGALDNLDSFLTTDDLGVAPLEPVEDPIPITVEVPQYLLEQQCSMVSKNIKNYIGGFLIRQILKKSKECSTCKAIFLSHPDKNDDLIKVRNYSRCKNSLIVPNSYFSLVVNQAFNVFSFLMPKVCNLDRISKVLNAYLHLYLELRPLNCALHNTSNLFVKLFVKFYIYHWCKNINRILRGKTIKLFKHNKNDHIKVLAYKKYLKSRKRKSRY